MEQNVEQKKELTLAEKVGLLARLRRDAERLQFKQTALLDEFRRDGVYHDNEMELTMLGDAIASLEAEVKTQAVDGYLSTGSKKFPGVTVKMMSSLEYNLNEATIWAREHLAEAIHLDTRFFEKHARAVAATKPVPCVQIVTEPQAQIDKDLSEWVNTGASVDEVAEVESEIPF